MSTNNPKKETSKRPADISMIYGKLPPQAKELEDAVLGACLLEKNAFDTACETLTADCFYSEANQRIFSAMQSLSSNYLPIDLLTVVQELKKMDSLEIVGGVYYVSKLTNSVTSGANVVTHARIVMQKFIQREVIRVASDLINDAYEDSTDAFDLLDSAEEKVMKISASAIQGDMVPINSVLDKTVSLIEEWRLSDGTLTGITSGFPEIDKATRGWQPGDLIYIGARPSVGKTAMALNLIRNAALNGIKPCAVAVWSLEMNAEYLALRMMAAESEIYLHRIQTGRLDEFQMEELIKKGVDKLRKAKIWFDDNSMVNLRILRSKARKLKKKNGLGLIVIDYLQLMSSEDNKGNREQEVSKISRGLKNLAKELQIPIIALSQISREADKGISWDVGPKISSMRESGGIEQDADLILLMWGPTEQEEKQDPNLSGKRRVKIAKARNGMLLTVDLDFKNEIQLFQSIQNTENCNGNFIPIGNSQPNRYESKNEDSPF